MNALHETNQRVSVVLVEDDQSLRDSLVEYLSLKGLDVKATGTAAGFYQLLEQSRFQVAVIDLGLPDASGQELVNYARQNSVMSLIVITANDGLNSRVSCYSSGADLFMGKPVQGQELAAAILSLAERQKARLSLDAQEEQATGWRLNSKSWSLITPQKEEIECTVKEYRLLALLAETPSEPVKRPRLLQSPMAGMTTAPSGRLIPWCVACGRRLHSSTVQTVRPFVLSTAWAICSQIR